MAKPKKGDENKRDAKDKKGKRTGGLGFKPPQRQKCHDCKGTGVKDGKTCTHCNGTGEF